MLQNAVHDFSLEQVKFLNRGPTYVPPCQVHLFSSAPTLKDTLIEQFVPLRKQLNQMYAKYSVGIIHQQIFQPMFQDQFVKSCSQPPIPAALQRRAHYEKQLVHSIQLQLKRDHLILRRTADDYNAYYLAEVNDFNRMAQDYIDNSQCYELIGAIEPETNNSEQQHITRIVQSMDTFFKQLVQRNLLPMDSFNKLQLGQRSNFHLPYLYFLPSAHQVIPRMHAFLFVHSFLPTFLEWRSDITTKIIVM